MIDFKAKIIRMQAAKISIMRAIANNSVNFFKITVFNAQGFIDKGPVERWALRKHAKRDDRKILVDTGHGRQSIHAVSITTSRVVIRAEAPYMRYQNEGTKNLPKRQFMGKSAILDQQNRLIIFRNIRQII